MNLKQNLFGTLSEVKKCQKRPDGIFGSFMTRPVSHIAALFFYRVKFTPNMVTFISFIFCATACMFLLMFTKQYPVFVLAALLWWIGAILDAADGDLARFSDNMTSFGGWFDSYLDRLKEFIIFGTLSYLAFRGYGLSEWCSFLEVDYGKDFYLLLGFLAIISNVMSGWITDTKKLFCNGERKVEVKLSEKYSFGMVDTRDFFVIVSLLTAEFRIALYVYGIFFIAVLAMQTGLFLKRYGHQGES